MIRLWHAQIRWYMAHGLRYMDIYGSWHINSYENPVGGWHGDDHPLYGKISVAGTALHPTVKNPLQPHHPKNSLYTNGISHWYTMIYIYTYICIYICIYIYVYIYMCVYIMIGKLIQTPHSILSIFYALCLKNCVDTGWVPTFFDVYGSGISKNSTSKRLKRCFSCAGFSLARSNSKTVVLSFGNLVTWKLGMEWTWFRPDPEWTGMGWLHVLVLDVWPLGERFFFLGGEWSGETTCEIQFVTHRIHVWYICWHLGYIDGKCCHIYIYTIHGSYG